MFHSGIKHKGTADAWYVRYLWINKGGTQTTTPPSYSKTHEKDTQNHMTGGENILAHRPAQSRRFGRLPQSSRCPEFLAGA